MMPVPGWPAARIGCMWQLGRPGGPPVGTAARADWIAGSLHEPLDEDHYVYPFPRQAGDAVRRLAASWPGARHAEEESGVAFWWVPDFLAFRAAVQEAVDGV